MELWAIVVSNLTSALFWVVVISTAGFWVLALVKFLLSDFIPKSQKGD